MIRAGFQDRTGRVFSGYREVESHKSSQCSQKTKTSRRYTPKVRQLTFIIISCQYHRLTIVKKRDNISFLNKQHQRSLLKDCSKGEFCAGNTSNDKLCQSSQIRRQKKGGLCRLLLMKRFRRPVVPTPRQTAGTECTEEKPGCRKQGKYNGSVQWQARPEKGNHANIGVFQYSLVQHGSIVVLWVSRSSIRLQSRLTVITHAVNCQNFVLVNDQWWSGR